MKRRPAIPLFFLAFLRCLAAIVGWSNTVRFREKLTNLLATDYERQDLMGKNFAGKRLAHASFKHGILREVEFSNARLQFSDFTDADLRNANFTNADLDGSKMDRADTTRAVFTDANGE
ncbi:MAG: pentapeptide repeat-containing protein [Pedosphaera sp.]|nr:pentapeptide repeat-containing protein [Pedosphaera sp.]